MSEKAVFTLNGNAPDEAEVMNFLTIMFGTDWPRGVEDMISEFANLVYSVTRRAGFTVYQDAEINPYLQQGRTYAATERVTIVYPIPAIKRLVWIDAQTGELTSPRKSPKRGNL